MLVCEKQQKQNTDKKQEVAETITGYLHYVPRQRNYPGQIFRAQKLASGANNSVWISRSTKTRQKGKP